MELHPTDSDRRDLAGQEVKIDNKTPTPENAVKCFPEYPESFYNVWPFVSDKSRQQKIEPTKLEKPMPKQPELATEERIITEGMLFGGLDYVPIDRRYDPPPRSCYKCWGFNHKRRTCPVVHDVPYCYNRGRLNTVNKACPRCAKRTRGGPRPRDEVRLQRPADQRTR